MAKKVKSVEVVAYKPSRHRWLLQAVGFVLVAGVLIGSVVQGRRYAEAKLIGSDVMPRIVLKRPPAWMSADLLARIEQSVSPISPRSSLDHDLLVEITQILRAEPWVKQVNQVRRVYGEQPGNIIEIDCEFRSPVALVEDGGYFWIVDSDGVKLPERYTPAELAEVAMGTGSTPKLRVITGVAAAAPQAGETWSGEDLRAGIELVNLLHGRGYADEVATIDISNYAGRRDKQSAQIILHTLREAEIRWGRPVTATKDFFVEVSTEKKLEHLQTIHTYLSKADVQKKTRYPWYDIRRERILVDAGADAEQATLDQN